MHHRSSRQPRYAAPWSTCRIPPSRCRSPAHARARAHARPGPAQYWDWPQAGTCSRGLSNPNRRVVEHGTAMRPTRIGRGDDVDAFPGLEAPVGPDALHYGNTSLLAGLWPDMDDRAAALIAKLDTIAFGDAHRVAILRVHQRRGPHLALQTGRSLAER